MAGTPASYEDFHKQFHSWMLTGDWTTTTPGTASNAGGISADLVTALATAPYDVTSYDATAGGGPVSLLGTSAASMKTELDALDVDTDFDTFLTAAIGDVDGVMSTAQIDGSVDAYERQQRRILLRAEGRLSAQFAEINAVQGSGFAVAIALLEQDHSVRSSDYETNMRMEYEFKRLDACMREAAQLLQAELNRIQLHVSEVGTQETASRFAVSAQRQNIDDQVKYDVNDATWQLMLYQHAGNALSSIAGAAVIPANPSELLQIVNAVSGVASTGLQGMVGIGSLLL